jgi:hypothetical protein
MIRAKTIEELEGVVLATPDYDSYVVSTVHRLRKKPIDEFTIEDLRIMIGQGIGLAFLIPLAINALERQPLAEGDFYAGDLLSSVIGAKSWLEAHGVLAGRVKAVVRQALSQLAAENAESRAKLIEFLQ